MTPGQSRDAVRDAVHRIVPDADLDTIAPEDNLRDALDSLDFLSFVESLSKSSGRRIDEDDYDKLARWATCIDFLSRQAA
jgi:acyl carrier protein